MKPRKQEIDLQGNLFQSRLEMICDPGHELVRLASEIDWDHLDSELSSYYADSGRPGEPTRLMVGLTYLQLIHKLSEEDVVARWVENPYFQQFTGETFFQHKPPIDRSSLSRWRKRIGDEGLDLLLEETLSVGLKIGVLHVNSLKRVMVDTTVQPKNITHPTDAKLYHRGIEKLVRAAKRHELPLRQSHLRLAKKALRLAGRFAHGRKMKRAKREIRKLHTYLGRVYRDVLRKLEERPDLQENFQPLLSQIHRLLQQKRGDKNKLYSLHEPHVSCIAKGKVHKKYEFGSKVSIATTVRTPFVIGVKSYQGNPYDGHTLRSTLEKVAQITGVVPERCYVDLGFRGHGVTDTKVYHPRLKRGITPTIKKEMKRRNGIEAVISHMKTEGRLDRNFLSGVEGDRINALFAGVGYNLRQILRWLRIFFAWILVCGWTRQGQILTK